MTRAEFQERVEAFMEGKVKWERSASSWMFSLAGWAESEGNRLYREEQGGVKK